MKKIYLLLCLLLVSGVYAYPNLNGQRVNDFANILNTVEIQNLTEQIYSMENITGAQFAIVTLLNTEGDDRTDYASHIGEQNGVGIQGKDNGVVILWSLDNEKGGAIATGRGIGSILTDVTVANIGRSHRLEFDNKQYYIAFSGILKDLENKFPNNETGISNNTNQITIPGWVLILILLGVVLFIGVVVAALSEDDGTGGSGFGGGYIGSSGGWSSSSSGSFGGGGFGGGSFGGGGAHF